MITDIFSGCNKDKSVCHAIFYHPARASHSQDFSRFCYLHGFVTWICRYFN